MDASERDELLARVERLEKQLDLQKGAVAALMHLALMRPTALSWYDTNEGAEFRERLAAPLELEGIVAQAQIGQLRHGLEGFSDEFRAGYAAVAQDLERALAQWAGPAEKQ